MKVDWSHLSMKAYEYFLLCNLCGAMIHDSPTSKLQHEAWHKNVADAMVLLLDEGASRNETDAKMAEWFAKRAIYPGLSDADHR